MIPSSDIQQQVYDLLARASNISFIGADQEAGTRLSLSPGQRVTAEVLTTLQPGNRTQVRIGSERFTMELPMAVRPGQTLEMTFVSEDPRSTFAIARQGGISPPVSLSDASRLLSLLVGSEQILDPRLRSSLQSIADILRRSSGETGVLANLMDEAATYGRSMLEAVKGPPQSPDDYQPGRGDQGGLPQGAQRSPAPEQSRLAAFEANASQILQHIARSSRFLLAEAARQPLGPLPLMPGEEVEALVTGTLPGGRVLVQVAGTSLELLLSRAVQAGDILRLTYIASQPKPLFALPRLQETTPGLLSEASRWLSVLEHSEGGLSLQQTGVLERLNSVLTSLPADSPAFTVIRDEARLYGPLVRRPVEQDAHATDSGYGHGQASLQPGNGIVLNNDMATLLQGLIKGNRLALLEAIGQQAATGLQPGQQLKGDVVAALGGGRFMVQVGGRSLELSLPRGIGAGERLNLFFIADEPHPTFLMARFGRPGDARVSDTGRWLSGFLGGAADQAPAQAVFGLMRTLLSEPPSEAGQVGTMLQKGLRESGLFYESHLARWFGGDYRLEDLLREPQGRLSRRVSLPVPHVGPETVSRQFAPTVELIESVMKNAASAPHEGIADQRSLPVIREQLNSLQNGQLLFRGELFPGQPMEWSVAERDARRGSQGERERLWETGLTIDLPRLGSIRTHLRLDGRRLWIDVTADRPRAVEQLQAGVPVLCGQLGAAGLEAADIGVRHAALS